MSIQVLWPHHRADRDNSVELEAIGDGVTAVFGGGMRNVTDEQWAACDGIVGTQPPKDCIDKLKKCRIFVKTAVGYDDVDIDDWSSRGIPVCNVPDYGTREVADHAIALMMTLTKSIAFHDESLRADPIRNWRPALNPYGRRMSDCTFGVIGLGRIGTATARRAKAFDMDVTFFDPYQPNGVELALGIRRSDSLEDLVSESDVISVHTPLNEETKNLLDARLFDLAKKGCIVINTARGPIIDIDALYEAMKNGTVLAAGLDVLPEEPAKLDRPLIRAWLGDDDGLKHRLVLTPHSAFFTPESIRDIRAFAARTAARFLRDGRLENCVNSSQLNLS
ncbi:MAG: C-terminal binding protein [Gammaproteobacteria bacterium]|nr:C-terminal binding protein [Gammaproteobacteria bacterium]